MLVRNLFPNSLTSLSAVTLSALLTSVSLAQQSALNDSFLSDGSTQVASAQWNQGYATSRPTQADSVGSNYQSMSPDSWGSSAPDGPDPFATTVPPGALNRAGLANRQSNSKSNTANDFVPRTPYTHTPNYLDSSQTYSYENTGAPSMQELLSNNDASDTGRPLSVAPQRPFRNADFGAQAPNDIPLAPTVPSSILDKNNNQLDSSANEDTSTNPNRQLGATFTGPGHMPPADNVTGVNTDPAFVSPSTSNQFQPSPQLQPPIQSGVVLPSATITPYQMPDVFESTPVAPTHAGLPVERSSGFGWGNAPGLFGRNQPQTPTYRQQPEHESRQRTRPRFPLPFGLGSRKTQIQPGSNFDPPSPQQVSQHQTVIPTQMPNRQFRPDLAQRTPLPTVRNTGTYDTGHAPYGFEDKKKQYPPFSEILATGKYFGFIEGQFVKPRFNGNSGITILDSSTGINLTDSQVFDFDQEFIPNFVGGFESKYGPGFEVNYRTLRTASIVQSFTNSASSTASLSAALPHSALGSQIVTTTPGQTLSGAHTFNLENFGFSVFKQVQLPVTRIGGAFGFQAVDIDHQVDATVTDGSGAVLQSLNTSSDMRAFGPRIRLDYFRPVGHTPLEFITSTGGAIMFGKRDQFILGPGPETLQRVGTDEIVTTFEFMTALQIKKRIGENRSVFARVGYLNQVYNNGGTGFLARDDFGLRGITFTAGINR